MFYLTLGLYIVANLGLFGLVGWLGAIGIEALADLDWSGDQL